MKRVKSIQKGFRLPPYTIHCLKEIMESGLFSTETEVVITAIQSLHAQLKQEGKLPTKEQYAHLHPKDRAIEEEIDRLMQDMEEGDELIVDRGTGEVRKVEKRS